MKKTKKKSKITQVIHNGVNMQRNYDRNEPISLDIVPGDKREEIESLIKSIDVKIEDIGKICDKKKQRSSEEYKNVIKSNKTNLNDELDKLKFKLIDTLNMNTKEDLLNKARKDLGIIKQQVFDKDRELQKNNQKLCKFENKLALLHEEKEFLTKEYQNARKYNLYLKDKLNSLDTIVVNKVESSLNNTYDNTSHILKTAYNPHKQNEIEKLDKYLCRQEEILKVKIQTEEKKIKEKFEMLKNLEHFDNIVLSTLHKHKKGYELNSMSKISNEDVFFNPDSFVPENFKTHKKLHTNTGILDYNLNKIDKKEIVKNFLVDEETKKHIYSLLYNIY